MTPKSCCDDVGVFAPDNDDNVGWEVEVLLFLLVHISNSLGHPPGECRHEKHDECQGDGASEDGPQVRLNLITEGAIAGMGIDVGGTSWHAHLSDPVWCDTVLDSIAEVG